MNITQKQVQVGTGIIVVAGSKILCGVRKGSHGENLLSCPGGHLEFGETIEAGVLRELAEECGPDAVFDIKRFSPSRLEVFVTNDILPQYDKHYITIFVVAQYITGKIVNMEPHKNESWNWYSFDEFVELSSKNSCAEWVPVRLFEEHRKFIGI